jgi:membrane protein implicated in regulation of membrane protease activity
MLLPLLLPSPLDQSGWGWLALAALLLIAEVATGTQHLLLIGLAAAATGLVTLLVPSWLSQDAWILLVALAALYALWGWKHMRRCHVPAPSVNNIDDHLIGHRARLSSPISGGEGRVKLGDSSWTAKGPDLPEGTEIVITAREGNTLFVMPYGIAPSPEV